MQTQARADRHAHTPADTHAHARTSTSTSTRTRRRPRPRARKRARAHATPHTGDHPPSGQQPMAPHHPIVGFGHGLRPPKPVGGSSPKYVGWKPPLIPAMIPLPAGTPTQRRQDELSQTSSRAPSRLRKRILRAFVASPVREATHKVCVEHGLGIFQRSLGGTS